MRIRLEQVELELEAKNNECKQLSSFYKSSDFQSLQKDHQELEKTITLAQSELDVALGTHESQKRIMLTLNAQLASRIHELATIHDEITTALQT